MSLYSYEPFPDLLSDETYLEWEFIEYPTLSTSTYDLSYTLHYTRIGLFNYDFYWMQDEDWYDDYREYYDGWALGVVMLIRYYAFDDDP